MNNKAFTFIKNFSYTLSSNLISLIISILVVLIVPKLIGIEEYGYWQLFLFYSSYVGFLNFGWNDGVYLRYGGKDYKELDKDLFFSQFWMLFILQILLSMGFLIYIYTVEIGSNKQFILIMTVVSMLILNIRGMLIYVLQGTNRIKEFAQIIIIEKVLYCFLILVLLLIGVRNYQLLIVANVLGNIVSLLYSTYCCRDIVYNKFGLFYFNFKEAFENIKVGIKLMFANIASMFIIGIVRLGIERSWDVATFGRVSLVLSISNLMMIFINAVGVVIFPILRRTNEEKLASVYIVIRSCLMVLLLGILVLYYPFKSILISWLPQYGDSLKYMALLFPMCVFEGKMALLINTYLKTIRKEKLMLYINLASVVLSALLTILSTLVIKNLSLAIVTIVLLLAFRCVLAEWFLSRILKLQVFKDIVLEVIMTIIFILTAWYTSSSAGTIFYLVAFGTYLLIKNQEIKDTFIKMKSLIKG